MGAREYIIIVAVAACIGAVVYAFVVAINSWNYL
jgi:hypothetical protein